MIHSSLISRLFPALLISLAVADGPSAFGAGPLAPLKILIVDGQHNHAWMTCTPLLKSILEESGRFTVDVSTAPAKKAPVPKLPPNATSEQQAAHAEKLQRYLADEPAREARSAAQWAKWQPTFS